MLKKLIPIFASLIFFSSLTAIVMAASSVNQGLAIAVLQSNALLVSGDVTLTIEEVDTPVTDSSTTLSYSTNAKKTRKITAELNEALPTGITLTMEIEDGTGEQSLSTNPVDVLTGLSKTSGIKTITYTAAVNANVEPQTVNAMVTFTLTKE